jgi:EthD domain
MIDDSTSEPAPAAYWRAAFIFDASDGDREALARNLGRVEASLRGAVARGSVRLGVAEHFLSGGEEGSHDYRGWRRNDGAIEVTVGTVDAGQLPQTAKVLREILEPFTDVATVEVMAGPVYFMVPPRLGTTFLSLSFKRDPATTKAEFRRWWFNRHASVAIPILGPLLLAYDQVHCNAAMTDAVSNAFGVPAVHYDAYDNLTWADWPSFQRSTADPIGGRRIFEDEIGRIDNATRRHGFMQTLGRL